MIRSDSLNALLLFNLFLAASNSDGQNRHGTLFFGLFDHDVKKLEHLGHCHRVDLARES